MWKWIRLSRSPFTPSVSVSTVETQEFALLIALHGDDRVGDQRDFDALLGEFRHGGIEQEGMLSLRTSRNGNLAPRPASSD